MPREMPSTKDLAVKVVRPRNWRRPALKTDPQDTTKISALIRAAEVVFLAKGYHAATMSDIAKAAGMSKRTVYQLIDSKIELFAALLEHHQERVVIPDKREDWTVHEALAQYLFCIAQDLLAPQQITIVRLILAEYAHGHDFGQVFYQKRVGKAKVLLESYLMEIRPPIYLTIDDFKERVSMLFGMALSEFLLEVLVGFRPGPTKEVLTRRIRLAVELFLKSCEAPQTLEEVAHFK